MKGPFSPPPFHGLHTPSHFHHFFQKRCEAHWPSTLIKFPNCQTLIECIEAIIERNDKHGGVAIGAAFVPHGAVHRGIESVVGVEDISPAKSHSCQTTLEEMVLGIKTKNTFRLVGSCHLVTEGFVEPTINAEFQSERCIVTDVCIGADGLTLRGSRQIVALAMIHGVAYASSHGPILVAVASGDGCI